MQVRLDPARLRALDRLVERRQAALFGEGVDVSRASYLRGLLDREIEAVALDEPRAKGKGKR